MPTSETGTRHRTAERVGRQIDVPVITVSEDMSVVAIHRRGEKHTLEPTPRVLARADQALQILGRYKARLDSVSGSLSALEVEDLVTVRDVATVLQRAEMVRRIAEEIVGYVVELGSDGRLVMLQLEELIGGVEDDRRLVAKDYFQESDDYELRDITTELSLLDDDAILDLANVAGGAPPRDRRRDRQRAAAARLPAAAQDPAAARDRVRPRGGALLEPPEDHARRSRRPHRGRRRGRRPRPRDQGRSLASRGDVDSRTLRVASRRSGRTNTVAELQQGSLEVEVEHISLIG